jgi:biuret amidohydrolase
MTGADILVEDATPYSWPFDGTVSPERCALVVCCDPSWRVTGPASDAADRRLEQLMEATSTLGVMVVAVTPDGRPPFTGRSPSHDVAVPGADGFFHSDLDGVLRRRGVRHLLLAGWGLEGPVHSTLRSANDRGYECLLVFDAAAPLDEQLIEPACSTVMMSGGIFGAYAPTASVLRAIATAYPEPTDQPASGRSSATSTAASSSATGIVTPAPVATSASRASRSSSRATGTLQEVTLSESESHHPLVDAQPYPWPFDGGLDPAHTALVLIDWQVDFCGVGGYVDRMGYDLGLTRAGLAPTQRVLERVRAWGAMVIHTREGHRPDLSDCPDNKLWRSKRIGAGIGDPGPTGRILVRGEPGWEIVPEVAPVAGELVIDKPGKGAFYATDLDLLLSNRSITHLVFTGITTDVCVHTTMRDANDRGYECLLLSDCTGATDLGNYQAALKMVTMQGGVFGAVATSGAFLAALDASIGLAV